MAIKVDHTSWRFTRTNGILMLFGIPFVAIGATFVGMILFRAGTVNGQAAGAGVRLLIAMFPMLFVFGGLGLMGFFRRFTVNNRTNTLTRQWGFFFIPFSSKVLRLEDEPSVNLQKELRTTSSHSSSGSSKKSYFVYPVRLRVAGPNVVIDEGRNMFRARQLAESLAKFIRAEMVDGSRGAAVIRSPEELDMCVGERLARDGIEPRCPRLPDFMSDRAYEVVHDGRTFTELRFPSLASRYLIPALIVVILLLSAGVYFAFQIHSALARSSGNLMSLMNFAFPVLVACAVAKYLFGAVVSTRILIAEDMVQVIQSVIGIPRRIVLDAREIEEINVDKGRLDLTTDRAFVNVLNRTRREEVKYCSDMLTYVLLLPYYEDC
jgi:hypothetical protein